MVATGWPLTSTRGTGAVGIAWPPCAHSTVAPKWRMGPGIALPFGCAPHPSDDGQGAQIDVDGWPHQRDGSALAVLNEDAEIVDDQHRAGQAFENDAAG